MKCFRCGSTLDPESPVCPRCGQDVRLYRKIIQTGNAWYNIGLKKAKVRDLTGAADALRHCLKFNKRHIEARNLLGLIYYETGEVIYAVREWIISQNYQAQNNPAERYLKDLQSSKNQFEESMQAVKKYNLALKYANSDGRDLAIIQLKKVLTTNPNMVRANLLLSLLYMWEGSDNKARRLLERVLTVDRGNTTALYYLGELKSSDHSLTESAGTAESDLKTPERKSGRRVTRSNSIIPSSASAASSYLMSAVYVLIGLVIGVMVLVFLILPSREQEYASEYTADIAAFEEELSAKDAEIAHNERELEDLREEMEELAGSSEESEEEEEMTEEEGTEEETEEEIESFAVAEACIEMYAAYMNGDYATVADYSDILTEDAIDSEAYETLYEQIYVDSADRMYQACVNAAQDSFNAQNYQEAVRYYESARKLNDDSASVMFWCAVSHHYAGESEAARELYEQVIEEFPGTGEASEAERMMGEL